MTERSFFSKLKATFGRLKIPDSEETFKVALDATLTEFQLRLRQRLEEMHAERSKLVRSKEFQFSGNQFADRLNAYRPLVKNLGVDFVDCVKRMLLPNCGNITSEQTHMLSMEFQKVIVAQVSIAKDAEERFAISVGRPSEIKSVLPSLEQIYYGENSNVRRTIESVVKQSNLQMSTKKLAERKKGLTKTLVDLAKKLFLGI